MHSIYAAVFVDSRDLQQNIGYFSRIADFYLWGVFEMDKNELICHNDG